ncbi:g4069 [Coccomyxa elongata]
MSNPVQMPNLRLAAQHLAVEAQAALLGHREQILQIDKERQDYESTAFMLDSLPKEGTHEIMVPLGKAAFFPGKLVDTQHCLVRMGDNTHLHSTTGEAAAVLHKRCQALLEKRTMLELELQDLEKKLAVARATLAVSLEESGESADATEGLFDIREEYDEALHGPTATDTAGLQTPESVTDNGVEKPREDTVAGSATAHSPPALHPTSGQSLRRKSVSFADEPNLAVPPPEAQLPQQRGMRKGFLDQPKPKPALKRSSKPAQAPGEATKFLERAVPLPRPGSFPALPQPGLLPLSLQSEAPNAAPGAGLAPTGDPEFPVLAPAPWGVGAAALPIEGPAPALAPRSPYDPIFNPIISKAAPNTNLQAQNSYTNMQTVSANSNGQVTTYNSNIVPGNSNSYGGGPSSDGSNAYGQQGQQQQQNQQQGQQQQQQQGTGVSGGYAQYGGANGQQANNNVQQSNGMYQNNNQIQMPYTNVAAPAPAPAPAAVAAVNPMVAAVDLAHQTAQTTPQFSLGQDGATIQQPVVTNAQDGVTSGGNQFKVNEYGVILGNFSNNGGVTIDPGVAGNLWNLAKQAATLYGRKMMM